MPPDDDPRRLAVREWIDAHPDRRTRDLARGRVRRAAWPAPWGLHADPIHQLIIDDELSVVSAARRCDQPDRRRLGGAHDLPRGSD